jgi:hypothetical protein
MREHMITQLIKAPLDAAARQRLESLGVAAAGGAQHAGGGGGGGGGGGAGGGGGGAQAPAPALPAMGAKDSDGLADDLLQDARFADAWLALGKGAFKPEQAQSFQGVKIAVPDTHKEGDTTLLQCSGALDSLGRDVTLLTTEDGSRPAQALASFNPALARIAVPLAFFSYKGAEYAAVQLFGRSAERWHEYTFLKPMRLRRDKGGVKIVPITHLYDRLRHLPYTLSTTKQSKTTVHVAVGL